MSRDADRLRAVAEHIETHKLPATSSVGVMWEKIDVRLFASEGERLSPFIEWADSLDADSLQLVGYAHAGQYQLHAIGTISGGANPIDVCAVIGGSKLEELINEFGFTGEDIVPSREQLAKIADQESLGYRKEVGQ